MTHEKQRTYSIFSLLVLSSCVKHFDPIPPNDFDVFMKTPPKDGSLSFSIYAPVIYPDSSIFMETRAQFYIGGELDTISHNKVFLNDQSFLSPMSSNYTLKPMFGQTLNIAFKDANNSTNFYFPQNIILSEPIATDHSNDNLMH